MLPNASTTVAMSGKVLNKSQLFISELPLTERGDTNREIGVTNNQLRQLWARIKKVKTWLYAQPLTNAPTLVETMKAVGDGKNLNYRWQKIANLKTQAKFLIFLQENNITDVPALADKVAQLYQSQYDLGNTIKSEERRVLTLNTHLAQIDIRRQHSVVYRKYRELDPKIVVYIWKTQQ